MARDLVYTSPARGHLYPLVPTLEELRRRGHGVAVRTLGSEVDRLGALGFSAGPIDPAIEELEHEDWKAASAPAALLAACRTFVARGAHEVADLRRAIAAERPEVLFTDVNSWGAAAAAEASGIPWAAFAPYFLPLRSPGVPPWGLGLAPARGAAGRLRDALLWPVVDRLYDRVRPSLNELRASAGAPRLRHVSDFATRAPLVDVSSGVERARGVKDAGLIRAHRTFHALVEAAGRQTDLEDKGIAKTAREEKLRAREEMKKRAEHERMARLYRQHVLKEDVPADAPVQLIGLSKK